MIRQIARFLDSLFWEVTIVTTVYKPIAKTLPPTDVVEEVTAVPEEANAIIAHLPQTGGLISVVNAGTVEDIDPTSVVHDGNRIIVGSRPPIDIPMMVATRPLLFSVEGEVDDTFHAAYPGNPMLIGVSDGKVRHAFVNHRKLTRNVSWEGKHLKKVRSLLTRIEELTDFKKNYSRQVICGDLRFVSVINSDWIWFDMQTAEGRRVRMYQDNLGQINSPSSIVMFSYVLTRNVLLSLHHSGENITAWDEDKIACSIVELLING